MKMQLTIAGTALILTTELVACFILAAQGAVFDMQGAAATRSTAGQNLAGICKRYYNDGTDRWKTCMGVELK